MHSAARFFAPAPPAHARTTLELGAEPGMPPTGDPGIRSDGAVVALSPAPDSRRTRSAAAAMAAQPSPPSAAAPHVHGSAAPAAVGNGSAPRRSAGDCAATAPHGGTANGLISSGSSAPDDGKAVTSPATAGARYGGAALLARPCLGPLTPAIASQEGDGKGCHHVCRPGGAKERRGACL